MNNEIDPNLIRVHTGSNWRPAMTIQLYCGDQKRYTQKLSSLNKPTSSAKFLNKNINLKGD